MSLRMVVVLRSDDDNLAIRAGAQAARTPTDTMPMSRTPQRSDRPVRTRRLAALAGIAVAAIGLSVSPGTGGAAARTSSTVIADEAERALEALERWQETRSPVDFVHFVQRREATATMTARELGIDPSEMRRAWATAPATKQQAVLAGMSQLGVPYRSHRSDPEVGFDCSGLTSWMYRQVGIDLPRSSGDQIRAVDEIELAAAEPGDLVYYPGHIGIYLGAGGYLHSPNSGNTVEATDLPSRSLRYGDSLADG